MASSIVELEQEKILHRWHGSPPLKSNTVNLRKINAPQMQAFAKLKQLGEKSLSLLKSASLIWTASSLVA